MEPPLLKIGIQRRMVEHRCLFKDMVRYLERKTLSPEIWGGGFAVLGMQEIVPPHEGLGSKGSFPMGRNESRKNSIRYFLRD